MEAIARWVITKFKAKYWGLRFEEDLPPEFIITNHAKYRASERVTTKIDLAEHTIRAWYKGVKPPRQFDEEKRPPELRYRKIAYRYHSGVVWVYGIRWIRQAGYQQKHLITILPVKK